MAASRRQSKSDPPPLSSPVAKSVPSVELCSVWFWLVLPGSALFSTGALCPSAAGVTPVLQSASHFSIQVGGIALNTLASLASDRAKAAANSRLSLPCARALAAHTRCSSTSAFARCTLASRASSTGFSSGSATSAFGFRFPPCAPASALRISLSKACFVLVRSAWFCLVLPCSAAPNPALWPWRSSPLELGVCLAAFARRQDVPLRLRFATRSSSSSALPPLADRKPKPY
jgi:hypothetical protein